MAEVLRDALYADKEAKGLGIHTKEQQDEISMRLFDVKHEQLLRY
jgi:hypothetical protein